MNLLLSTARRFNGIFHPSKWTFSSKMENRSRGVSARILANLTPRLFQPSIGMLGKAA